MTIEAALRSLGESVCSPGEKLDISEHDLARFAERTVVALATGGQSSRLQSIIGDERVHKNALPLPNNDTMIEMSIRMYRDAGFNAFVSLVSHEAQSIVDLVGDGERLGVSMAYSHDSEAPMGRGGAIRKAMDHGLIPPEHNLIVHNPDDVIVNYPGSFVGDVIASHLAGLRQGAVATAVVVDGSRAPYTALHVQKGMVTETISYPLIPIPAHIGVTIFAPGAYESFLSIFGPNVRTDFESELFPVLAREGTLYSAFIPRDSWLQVNDPKAWNRLVEMLEE